MSPLHTPDPLVWKVVAAALILVTVPAPIRSALLLMVLPSNSSLAFCRIVIDGPPPIRAEAPEIRTTPSLMLKAPVWVLAPKRTRVPAPFLVTPAVVPATVNIAGSLAVPKLRTSEAWSTRTARFRPTAGPRMVRALELLLWIVAVPPDCRMPPVVTMRSPLSVRAWLFVRSEETVTAVVAAFVKLAVSLLWTADAKAVETFWKLPVAA